MPNWPGLVALPGWVADHLSWALGECFRHGWGVAEAFEEDLPDRGAEAFGLLVVGPARGLGSRLLRDLAIRLGRGGRGAPRLDSHSR